jgi:hypothetical protein
MGVIRYERLCITGGLRLRQEYLNAFKKIFAVFVVPEYVSTFYSPYNNVM